MFKSANPNIWCCYGGGGGALEGVVSMGEEQTPAGGGAGTLEVANAAAATASASTTISTFSFVSSWYLQRWSHCRAS